MSQFPVFTAKELLILTFLLSWFGLLAFVFLHLLPLLILDHPLMPLRFSFSVACGTALLFLAVAMFLFQVEISRMLYSGLTFGILLGILYGLTTLLLVIINFFFPDLYDTTAKFLLFIILACTLIRSRLRKMVENIVDRFIFKERPDYYALFDDISGRMATSVHLRDLAKLLTVDFPEKLQITAIGLMILEQKRSRLFPEDLRFGTSLWSKSRMVTLLRQGKRFFFCKKEENDLVLSRELQEIKEAGFSLAYGLQGGSLFAGMLFLGPRQDGSRYTKQDLQAFSTLAHQVSTAVENALHFEFLESSNRQLQNTFNKLVEAKKMAALGEMTATLAHELITPLSIIRSSAQYLLQGQRDKETQKKLLNYVVDEVDGLNQVINNLLGLARHKTPHFNQVNVRAELKDFVDKWTGCEQHSPDITIELDLPDRMPTLYADIKQLRQVLTNCVSNSEEAIKDKGTITISFREIDQQQAEFCIGDTGPGIAEEDLKLAFKKFFTTKEKGVGLGLPVCRQIMRAHNGSIKLINNKGIGTLVILRLPLLPLANISRDNNSVSAFVKEQDNEN